MNMDFYLVHSIKGGCGKTTLSLSLSAQLAANNYRVCLLDMDFKGTGLGYLLLDDDHHTAICNGISKPDEFTNWNTCFTTPTVDFSSHMLLTAATEKNMDRQFSFDLAISDVRQSERDKFVSGASAANTLAVDIAIFRFKLLEVIETLRNQGYNAVVLDMPPSFDEYTKVIFHEFSSKDSRESDFLRRNHSRIFLYLVTSYDPAHLGASADFLVDHQKRSGHRRRQFDQIRLIFNDVSNAAMQSHMTDLMAQELRLDRNVPRLEIPWNDKIARACSVFGDSAARPNVMKIFAPACATKRGIQTALPDDLIVKSES